MGLTETEAKAQGIKFQKSLFLWAASGRAIAKGRDVMAALIESPCDYKIRTYIL